MTISAGSFILLLCSVLTGLIVEAIKKMWNIDKPNILAAIVSVIVGVAISVGYMILTNVAFSVTAVLFIVSIVVLSWLSAMLGYDKVMQTISQLGK